jgi:hypothetical protein
MTQDLQSRDFIAKRWLAVASADALSEQSRPFGKQFRSEAHDP